MDNHSKIVRSYNMSRIRSKGTKPEMIVRKFLFSKGFRYKLHDKKLIGSPDIVLPRYKTVIFVHGCFWHSHKNCKYAVTPKSNINYWKPKIEKNRNNDIIAQKYLENAGWNVLVIWECELKKKQADISLNHLVKKITIN